MAHPQGCAFFCVSMQLPDTISRFRSAQVIVHALRCLFRPAFLKTVTWSAFLPRFPAASLVDFTTSDRPKYLLEAFSHQFKVNFTPIGSNSGNISVIFHSYFTFKPPFPYTKYAFSCFLTEISNFFCTIGIQLQHFCNMFKNILITPSLLIIFVILLYTRITFLYYLIRKGGN